MVIISSILRLQWSNALCESPVSGDDQELSSGVLMELIVPNNHGGGSLSMEVCRRSLGYRDMPNRIQKPFSHIEFDAVRYMTVEALDVAWRDLTVEALDVAWRDLASPNPNIINLPLQPARSASPATETASAIGDGDPDAEVDPDPERLAASSVVEDEGTSAARAAAAAIALAVASKNAPAGTKDLSPASNAGSTGDGGAGVGEAGRKEPSGGLGVDARDTEVWAKEALFDICS